MSTKLIKKLTLASYASLLLLGAIFSSANAQDLAMKTYEIAPGVRMVLPAEDLTVEPGSKVNNKFLIDAEVLGTLNYKGMRTEVLSFKMDIVANPLDFLTIYAKALGLGFKQGQVARNKKGVAFGMGNFIIPSIPDQPIAVGVAFAGDRGYLMQSKTKSSVVLTKTVMKDMQLPGAAWGELIPLKSVEIGAKRIETNETFNVTGIAEGPMKGVILTNGATMEGSSIILAVKTNLLSDHDENRKVFEGELASGNLEFKPVRNTASETFFMARSKKDTSKHYMGYISSTGSSSISLIVPTGERDANSWMSGRYYYTKALVDLKK